MVFVLIVLPYMAFSILIVNIYSDRLEQLVLDSLRIVSDAQIAEMTNFCEQQNEYLKMLGNMDISRRAIRGEISASGERYLNDMLFSYVDTNSYMYSLAILDKNLRVVGCSFPEHKEFAEAGMDKIIKFMGTRSFYISDVVKNKEGKKILVMIAKLEEEGELSGYAIGEINLDFYAKIRERTELWNESTFYLLDGRDNIISAGTSAEDRDAFITAPEERKNFSEKYSAINIEENPSGNFRYCIAGKDYITYYSAIDFTDWRILLSVSMDDYSTERKVYITLAVFLTGLCIILAIWIGWFASRRIVRPIKRISATLKAIQEKQDYSLRVEVERKDELGKLAGEINELIFYIETEDLYKMQQQRLLQEKAGRDALTKVLNKEMINEYAGEAIERHKSDGTAMAVLFVDIDDFKEFNTNFGHSIGDQVLLFVVSILKKETKGTVGRVGGDEFLVIVELPESVHNLENCLENINLLTKSRFILHESNIQQPVSCCIGAARVNFPVSTASDITTEYIVNIADAAMYQAKENGKCGYVIIDL